MSIHGTTVRFTLVYRQKNTPLLEWHDNAFPDTCSRYNVTTILITCLSNSNWANDPDDQRLTFASCLFFGSNLVSWSSKKQAIVSRYNSEVEYHVLAHTTYELLWLESLLGELHIPYSSTMLFCDYLIVVMLFHNPVLYGQTKHIELDIYFVLVIRTCVSILFYLNMDMAIVMDGKGNWKPLRRSYHISQINQLELNYDEEHSAAVDIGVVVVIEEM
ncbi:hypothetical protein KIW84_022376 [Lathyrus oleraceus]|uniref:Uncharacterized protein n=1 Tax=Pisum sativum TaxID=3888 RepID=A0A9D5B6K2_PEA|nr:hypothetical protein KIW84_022376 [Pisum sativum]